MLIRLPTHVVLGPPAAAPQVGPVALQKLNQLLECRISGRRVRERLHLKPGDRFKFFFHPDGVIILPKIPTSRLKGIIPKPPRPVSLDEIDTAIEAGATQRFKRKK